MLLGSKLQLTYRVLSVSLKSGGVAVAHSVAKNSNSFEAMAIFWFFFSYAQKVNNSFLYIR